MAATGVGFRWLDILEKEFDKACVELDTSLSEMEAEEPDIVFTARQKVATLGSCFAQLTHKALTIFQNSAKIEAELVDLRTELVQARAASNNACEGDASISSGTAVIETTRAKAEAVQLARENTVLRETVLALHSELFGAKLATKYLDKELAGRIQQLQLLGREMRSELRDSLWAQVEAEILLQRHKTLVRVCRGLTPCPPRPRTPPRQPSRPRTVRVRRSPHLGLGISITGGREHGVPILISELETGGPAALTGELYVGDAILAINDVDLTQACHKEAVQALQSVKGDCALCVQFIATDDDDNLSDDHYRFPLYPDDGEVYEGERDGSGATPTAPRTPENNRAHSEDSGSGCESPHYTEVKFKPSVGTYPDYNSINNNLSILDMDDDSIKIETQVEPVKMPSSAHHRERAPPRSQRHLGRYHGLPDDVSSSNDSPHSTPVHGRRPIQKKKKKSLDWKSKGAYRPVDDVIHSSDEVPLSPQTSTPNGHLISTVFPAPSANETRQENKITNNSDQSNEISDLSPPISNLNIGEQPEPKLPTLPPPKDVELTQTLALKSFPKILNKSNGLEKKLLKGRPFRIGSAKRISEGATSLTNGESVEKVLCSSQLLTGDGDPDFGTPV